jgi:homopolymeric O-antigen transport system ATP-binding protein
VRDVLVLDEIFAVGDAGFKAKCEERYRSLRAAGHAVLLVSHEPRASATFCDRAILIDRGSVMRVGNAPDVVTDYLRVVANPTT